VQIALAFDDEAGRIKAAVPEGKYFYTPQVYCSDAFVSEQIASTVKNATYEGVDLYASPESGFNKAYRQRFGEELVNGEAQFYDALCLVAYAAVLQQHTGQGLNETLFITAANPYETSHADVWSEQVGVYLSNGFTRGFQEAIATPPAISLRDLYYTLARNTSGSHVKVYNAPHYGSVYSNTMSEFLIK